MKKVFISFSSKQTEEAKRICHLLESQGISCFISTRDLMPGEEYAAQLLNHIDEAKVVEIPPGMPRITMPEIPPGMLRITLPIILK